MRHMRHMRHMRQWMDARFTSGRSRSAAILAAAGSALALSAPLWAGATTTNLTYYPNYPGLQGKAPLGVAADSAAGFSSGSWQANVTGSPNFTSIILDPMALFGRNDILVSELASVSYFTKKAGLEGSVDWFFQFYTDNYAGDPSGAAWYGHRINSEPYFSGSLNAPVNTWNQWVTDSGPDNRLRFYDSTGNYFGGYTDPFLDAFQLLTYPIAAWNLNGAFAPIGGQEISFFNLGLGTAWATGFAGRIDGIRIELMDGSVATVNLEDFPLQTLELVADQSCYTGGVGELVTVTVELTGNASDEIVGGQFFLEYDDTVLQFVSATPAPGEPFELEIFEFQTPGFLQYAVGVDSPDPGTTGDATMAVITFQVLDDLACSIADAVSFSTTPFLPTTVTDEFSTAIYPDLTDLATVTFDSVAPALVVPANIPIECDDSTLPANTGTATAPDICDGAPDISYVDVITPGACAASYTITRTWTASDDCGNESTGDQTITVADTTDPLLSIPADITVYSDPGECSADIDVNAQIEEFTDPVVIAPAQAPGVWYTDRYAPFGFTNAYFDGDDRLKHSINAADCEPCRPGGFNGAFYNTQGRKYDTPGATAMSIELYVPAGWASTGRRMAGFWGTALNSGNAISFFPIIEFTSTLDGSGLPRFRAWNGGGWNDLGLPSGFAYDAWQTLEFELIGTDVVYTVGDLTLTLPSNGSVQIGNTILQGHNNVAGVTYDIHWDNLTVVGAPSASDNCDPAPTVVGVRSDAMALTDPYPAGVTTITWTATDECGNSTSLVQTVTVLAFTPLAVEVELFGGIDPGPFTRCIEFDLDCGTIVTAELVFNNGIGVGTIEVPCSASGYTCITARDSKHTLRSTSSVSESGGGYETSFLKVSLVNPGSSLIGGNANGDTFIDILDFGAYVGQYNTSPGANTLCGHVGFNADFNGDGDVDVIDFSFIQVSFFEFDAAGCCPMPLAGGAQAQPLRRVRVSDLRRMGYPNYDKADLNSDGWVDTTDVALFMAGQ